MRNAWSRSLPSWRASDARRVRPELALGALALLAMLLLEVWQSSAVASLAVAAGRANDHLQRASNELEWTRAQLDRSSSRSEVGSLAEALGVRPAEATQVVWLPSEYLEGDGAPAGHDGSHTLLAVAGRALLSLVPEATARGRHVN